MNIQRFRKTVVRQFDFAFAGEPMRLTAQTAVDGDRIQSERERQERDRRDCEAMQTAFQNARQYD